MAKGNDGNYLQHSVEVAIALHLAKLSTQGALHLALTHGMAPFEPCDAPLVGQSRGLLRTALEAAQSPPTPGEAPIITAYRATKASLDRYPNTGELLAATVGRDRLSGGIAEVDARKHAEIGREMVRLGCHTGQFILATRGSPWRRSVVSCYASCAVVVCR